MTVSHGRSLNEGKVASASVAAGLRIVKAGAER